MARAWFGRHKSGKLRVLDNSLRQRWPRFFVRHFPFPQRF
jgi:hypothetical protein